MYEGDRPLLTNNRLCAPQGHSIDIYVGLIKSESGYNLFSRGTGHNTNLAAIYLYICPYFRSESVSE